MPAGFDNILEEDVYNGEMGHAAKHNAVNDQVNFLTEELATIAADVPGVIDELIGAKITDQVVSEKTAQPSFVKPVPRLPVAMPGLHPAPPTVSYSGPNTASALSSPKVWPVGGGNILRGGAQSFVGADPDQAGNPYKVAWPDTGNELPAGYLEFVTDAPTFEVIYQGIGGTGPAFRIWIDGALCSAALTSAQGTASGAQWRMSVPLGSRKLRAIRIDTQGTPVSSIVTKTSDTVLPTVRPRRLGFLMDSYGLTGGIAGIPQIAARLVGCEPVLNASGGTGYLNNGGGGTKTTFINRLPGLLASTLGPLDYLVIAGGINDGTSGLGSAVATTLDVALATLEPDRIFVLGPWTPPSQSGSTSTTKRNAINAECAARGVRFIDNVTEGWQTGTGNTSSTTGDGNADVYMDNGDTTHVNSAGAVYLGTRLGLALADLIGVAA